MKLSRRQFFNVSGWAAPLLAFSRRRPDEMGLLRRWAKREDFPHEVWIELHMENMARNLSRVRKRTGVPVMAVIKANAYGHGLIEVGRFLARAGIDALMVGNLREAIALREAGVRCPILNFGPFHPGASDILLEQDISPSVFTDKILHLHRRAQAVGRRASVHIHVDTGMGRMGIPFRDALPFLEKAASLPGIRIQGISTTLTEDPEYDRVQLDRFARLCRQAEAGGIRLGRKHAFSSAGILSSSAFLDMVRPGILLYGYYPSEKTQEEDVLSLRPVLELKSRVAAVKPIFPGDSVSYHRAYRSKQKEKIAVIPAGYSDGYPSNVAGKGWVLIRGRRFPLVGAVTANHLIARLPFDTSVSEGDEVVMIGAQGRDRIGAEEVARWAGVSSYKVLLGLNPLLPRKTV